MKIELKPFITLLRRAVKCRYSMVYMMNHLLIQCYSIDIDSDIGLHYVLFIPDTEEYDSPFYDELLELYPSEILKVYSEGHKVLLDYKKEKSLKPKDVYEELHVTEKTSDSGISVKEIKFLYYANDSLIHTAVYQIPYPVDISKPSADNCVNTLTALMGRIKPGGYCMRLDGLRLGIFNRAMEYPDIYYHIVKLNGTKIRLPLMKSMFLGSKKFDSFIITLQESTIPGIYVYCLMFHRDGISECFYGYIQNY